jgi:predicted MFS family arabinose efflux permease
MFNAARIVGPAIGGLLIGAAGIGACFLINGLSYIAVIAGLLAIRLPPQAAQVGRASGWEGFHAGVRFIWAERRVRVLMILVAVMSVLGFPVLVLMPVIARDVLHTDARGYGLLMAAVGVGAMLGALALALAGHRTRKGPALLLGGVAYSVLLMAFAATRVFLLALLLLALAGWAMIITTALANTLLQTIVPDDMRGRVMAFYAFVFVGMAPLGAFQAGLIGEHLGAPLAIALGGAGCLVTVLVTAWWGRELRQS